jgi:RimJ/RimL family protein N-acetyltransferase
MEPFVLRTARLILDQPVSADIGDIARYCSDPVFERFLTIPWPYRRADAVAFVEQYVTTGWAGDREWTWAIRAGEGDPLLGVIGLRRDIAMVGFWLGAEHRGRGILPEALTAVVDEVFARTDRERVQWECVLGNAASLRVAQKCGFRFTGVGPGQVLGRTGEPSTSWTAVLDRDDDRAPKPGWPDVASPASGRDVARS